MRSISVSGAETSTAIIVGGSLGGLTSALALAKAGIASTVLERTSGRTQRGVAILVSGSNLERAVGPQARNIIAKGLGEGAMRQGSLPHAWWDVYTALREAADAEPLITVVEGCHINEVGEDATGAWAIDDSGAQHRGSLLIGADGYRSVTRRHVDAARPHANYAGNVTWLGQSELPANWQDRRAGGPDFFPVGRRMLAVYPLIEADGSVAQAGWGLIDPTNNKLFTRIGALDSGVVRHTPRITDIPDEVYEQLASFIERGFEEPWASLVSEALRERHVIATPITEYVPDRVTTDRVALIGDAAHAQTLMTGAGFREAVNDAYALSAAFEGVNLESPEELADALAQYSFMRLNSMRGQVESGMSFSRAFAA